MKNRKQMTIMIILTTLTALTVSFIFINSIFDADLSSQQSAGVLEFINSVFRFLNINIELSHHFVRKCAHFVEYFVLGTLLFYNVKAFLSTLSFKLLFAPVIGLVVAVVDETIQLFSPGRAGQVSDVLLDFSAVLLSFFIFFVITKLYIKHSFKGKEV